VKREAFPLHAHRPGKKEEEEEEEYYSYLNE
jgi:hypothetical protein